MFGDGRMVVKVPEYANHDGPGWKDIALASALAEEIAKDEREADRIRKEMEEGQEKDEKDED